MTWDQAKAPGRWARLRYPVIDRFVSSAEFIPVSLSEPVVVFSMGKTGTTSLTEAIERETGRCVLKVHSLNQSRLRDEARSAAMRGERPRFQWRSDTLRRIVKHAPHRRWDLVSVVRDPIARALSAFFYARRQAAEPTMESIDFEALAPRVENFVRMIALERDWFVEELRHATGIDVYQTAFDTDLGYQIITQDRFRVLLLRNEDLRVTAPRALAEFFDLSESVELPQRNAGRHSDPEYEAFLDQWQPSVSLVDAAYETRMMRHFYDLDEIDGFRRRWLRASMTVERSSHQPTHLCDRPDR